MKCESGTEVALTLTHKTKYSTFNIKTKDWKVSLRIGSTVDDNRLTGNSATKAQIHHSKYVLI